MASAGLQQSTVAARLVKDGGRDTTLKACFSVESYTGAAGHFKTSCGFEYHHFIQCSSIFIHFFYLLLKCLTLFLTFRKNSSHVGATSQVRAVMHRVGSPASNQ